MISAILLGAGESRRMGRSKQLIPFGRSTVLEESINNLLDAKISEVILVLGFKAEEVMRKLAAKPAKVVVNYDYQRGMSTSMIAGLRAIDGRAQAVMFAMGDQPLIDSQTIDRLIEEFYRHDKGIVIPTYQGRRGHPVIFALKFKGELLELKGDTGAKQIISNHPEDVLEVAVKCEGICMDIDTGEQLSLMRSRVT